MGTIPYLSFIYCLRSATECITHTWVFHYGEIFDIIPTLLRLHKSMKLRFFHHSSPLPGFSFSNLSRLHRNNIKNIFMEKMLRQMRNLNFISPCLLLSFLAIIFMKLCKFNTQFFCLLFGWFDSILRRWLLNWIFIMCVHQRRENNEKKEQEEEEVAKWRIYNIIK